MPFSWNTSYAFDNVTLATNGTVYGSLSYGGIHMYDGVLTPEQLTAVTNYFTQGSANVIANARPLIQANPIPYATGDVITGAPAQSFDVVGNMRVRALTSMARSRDSQIGHHCPRSTLAWMELQQVSISQAEIILD